jgi:hypothetical protein
MSELEAPSLPELQRAFGLAIAGREDAAVAHVLADGIAPGERLGVYRGTFTGALVRALRLSYPAVLRLVGAEFFEGAARVFIDGDPPRSACLDDYGAGFADFLARFEPAAPLEYLPSVARLEWAVNRALHASDAAPLDTARLAQADDPAQVRFSPHPSASLVRSDYPADAIWRAVLDEDDAALAAIDLSGGPAWLLVHRKDDRIEVERLEEDGWRFTAALFAGRPLHRALDEAPCADAQALLAAHLAAGRFSEFSLKGTGGTQ